MKDLRTIWREGASAHGRQERANPYSPGTRSHMTWQAGWTDSEEAEAAQAATADQRAEEWRLWTE